MSNFFSPNENKVLTTSYECGIIILTTTTKKETDMGFEIRRYAETGYQIATLKVSGSFEGENSNKENKIYSTEKATRRMVNSATRNGWTVRAVSVKEPETSRPFVPIYID